MTNSRLNVRPLMVAAAVSAILLPLSATAISRRDQAAVDALTERMKAAETRYANALVNAANASPDAQREGDAALEDMEDVVNACVKQRGCPINTMLSTYKRLLKHNIDGGSTGVVDEDDESDAGAGRYGVAADVPESARAAALLSDKDRFARMVEFNPAVQHGIRRWLTDMRGPLMNSYENYQNMRHLMAPEWERAGLPEALLFGIMAKESNGRVHSTSRAGAAGPMQFMYQTGIRFGLGQDGTGFDTRYDARASAQASAAYMNERMRSLDGNIEMALAAYNGGEGRAQRVYNQSGGRSFWDESVYRQFPAETQDYVPMVIAAAWLFMHPKEYGITWPKVDAKIASLRLSQPMSIYQLTICMGNAGSRDGYMRVLRNLNPRYQAEQMLPSGTHLNVTTRMASLYGRHCENGARADLARTLVMSDPTRAIVRTGPLTPVPTPAAPVVVAAAPAKPSTPKEYRVQNGETLSSIARKFDCSVSQLARANEIDSKRNVVRAGQVLKLQGCTG